jgi:carboxymethylenebutenolidase
MNEMHGSPQDATVAGATAETMGLTGLASYPLPRRGIVMTSLMTGFTLATTRVQAQVITTDTDGIVAEEVKIPVADGMIPGYFAKPKGAGPFPIVLVNEEIFGVHEYIKDTCRRFAKAGYAAIAPEIYARLGDISKVSDVGQIISQFVSKAPDATVMSDLDAAVAYAAKNGGNANKLAVTGFCRGGRNTWLYAAHNPAVKAAVAWYGPIKGGTSDIQPKQPIDIAADLKAPLLGLYGGKDTGIPVADVLEAQTKARATGKTVEIQIFPDAPHGFHADYRPSYRADAALTGWTRAITWFKEHGVA